MPLSQQLGQWMWVWHVRWHVTSRDQSTVSLSYIFLSLFDAGRDLALVGERLIL
jgi:endo-1,4-beta-D-glucanase Y